MEALIFISAYILFLLVPTALAGMWPLFMFFVGLMFALGIAEIISIDKTGKSITQNTREVVKKHGKLWWLPAIGMGLFVVFLIGHFYKAW